MDKQSVRVNKETIKFVNKTYEKLSILKCFREDLRYFNYDSDDEVIDENIDKVYELLDEIYFKSIEKKSSNIVKKDELKPRKLVFDDDHEEIVEPITPSPRKNILEHVLEYSSSSDDDNTSHYLIRCDNPQPMEGDLSVCVTRCGCCKGCENFDGLPWVWDRDGETSPDDDGDDSEEEYEQINLVH